MIGIKELSEYIGLKSQTIRNQVSLGTFPIPTKKIGRLLKWNIRDVDKYFLRKELSLWESIEEKTRKGGLMAPGHLIL